MAVVQAPVYNEYLEQGRKDGERSLDSILSYKVGIRRVQVVCLFPQEDFSFKLKGEHTAEQPGHELIDKGKKVATCYILDTLFRVVLTDLPVKGNSQQTNKHSLANLSFDCLWLS